MISGSTYLEFILASFIIIVIPGPSVLFVIGRSLTLGRRAGLLSVLGNGSGVVPVVFAVAFGVGAIVEASIVLFTIIKIAGACYLAFLGIQSIRHRKDNLEKATSGGAKATSARRVYLQGFIVGLTNPKSLVFFIAVLPQFVNRSAGNIPWQFVGLGLTFMIIGLMSDAVWAFMAGSARDWFATNPKRMSRLSAIGGGMMIGLSGVLLLTGNKR